MNNHAVVCVRDGSCGVGGIHCSCCNHNASDRTFFSRLVRTRLKNLANRDLARNPY